MRDIRFRAWDKSQNKIIYDFLMEGIKGFDKNRLAISLNSEIFCFTDWDMANFEEDEMHNTSQYVNRFELMQYTGLKDKNGKEIYEGDIVYIEDEECLASIEWDDENCKFAIYSLLNCVWDFDNFYGIDLEVIGNIYENPELLKDK